ncbi:MAG: hypothetical protein U0525_02430 [Patescibacteria group bacterium]
MTNTANNKSPNRSTKIQYLVLGFVLFLAIATIGTLLIIKNQKEAQTSNKNEQNLTKIAAEDISLEPYCKDGYYKIPTETKVCSRAPGCGGYDYDTLNTDAYRFGMTGGSNSHNECMGNVNANGKDSAPACQGYVPLCCYEMARTGDFTKCIGYWERMWCAQSQCDTAVSRGASDSQCGGCQCAHAINSYCGNVTPVSLSVRLGGVAPTSGPTTAPTSGPTSGATTAPTSGPTSGQPTATNSPTGTPTKSPSPSYTMIPTRTATPTKTPTNTPTATNTPTPTSTITPTKTQTPSPSISPTPTSTITPTPPKAAMCDRACGVCGWRDTAGKCNTAGIVPALGTACCYSTCINNTCTQVSGYGSDNCTMGSSCVTGGQNVVINQSPIPSPLNSLTKSPSITITQMASNVTPGNTTPGVTIIYVTATPKLIAQNNQNTNLQQTPTTHSNQNNQNSTPPSASTTQNTSQAPITGNNQPKPPVTGDVSWALLILIPIVLISAAIIL